MDRSAPRQRRLRRRRKKYRCSRRRNAERPRDAHRGSRREAQHRGIRQGGGGEARLISGRRGAILSALPYPEGDTMTRFIFLIAAAALAGCGVETASTAATAAALKKQEIEQGKRTMEQAQQKIGNAMEQMQHSRESAEK